VGGRAALLQHSQAMADTFDCTPFKCTCQGFSDYYGVNQGAPNWGTGCAPPDALEWSASKSCKGVPTTGKYCGGAACTHDAKEKYCTQRPADPGSQVYVSTAPSSSGPWKRGLKNMPLLVKYNADRTVWPQSATNPSALVSNGSNCNNSLLNQICTITNFRLSLSALGSAPPWSYISV
jgi:hypothetical protein